MMSNTLTPIDIRDYPELLRLVEEVAITNKLRELKWDNQTVALPKPVELATQGKTVYEASYVIFQERPHSERGT